jgi:hypothetical protein
MSNQPFSQRNSPSTGQQWSKQELKDRIMAAMDFFNKDPVVHTWTYKLDTAA